MLIFSLEKYKSGRSGLIPRQIVVLFYGSSDKAILQILFSEGRGYNLVCRCLFKSNNLVQCGKKYPPMYWLCNNHPGHLLVKDGASYCYCAYVLRISGYLGFLRNLPPNVAMFCAVYDYLEKADLSKGCQNPKRKLFPHGHNLCKNTSVLGGTILNN